MEALMRTPCVFLGILVAGCGASTGDRTHAAAEMAEVRACSGVSPDQARGPFQHREDIVAVEPLAVAGDTPTPHDVGARTIFRRRPGETVEVLGHMVACELARDRTLGRPERGTEQFPEAVPGVDVHVSSVRDGIAVDVTTTHPADVAEILRRARALAAH
jgi:hypothetical protein